jgi:hypothetical protein
MRKRQVDEDVLALLREWELADEAERLAENGVCEMEDLEFMKEEDVQKFGLRLKFVGLLQHVAKQKEKKASGGSTEQNAEPTGSSAGDIAEPATGATERSELDAKSVRELREICRIKGIDSSTCLYKRDLVDLIIRAQGLTRSLLACSLILFLLLLAYSHIPRREPLELRQEQNMPGKTCEAPSFLAQLKSLETQGDAPAILQGMLTHSEHAAVQQQACEALASLAIDAVMRVKIAEAGGIEAVIGAMAAHKTSALVQEKACRALWNLSDNVDNQLKIAAAGGIEALTAAMKAHTTSAGVQEHACGALKSLSFNNDSNKVAVAAAGGIEALVGAMQAHKTSALVQRQACWALRNLAGYTANRAVISEAGGIEALVAALKTHQASVLVQEPACLALYDIAGNARLREHIKAAGGVELVKRAVSASDATADTKVWGKRLLDLLA